MTRKWLQTVCILLFLLGISMPTLFTLFTDQAAISTQEKRKLAAIPEYPDSAEAWADWPQGFEDYFQDNFGYRNGLLSLYHQLKYAIKDPSVPKVIYGTEPGWLFYNYHGTDPVGDYRNINQFTAQDLQTFIVHLQQKQQWLAQQGIPYLFVLTPSKHYIYPEYLPQHLSPVKAKNLKQQLSDELKKHPEINYLDLTDNMLKHKDQALLYLKGDTHWNFVAGNFAQHEMINRINTLLDQRIEPKLWSLDDFSGEATHRGDLALMLKVAHYFDEPLIHPPFAACARQKINPESILERPDNRHYLTHCPNNQVDALIYRDSFFDRLQPYISGHFKRVMYLKQRFQYTTAATEITQHKPDIVIEQYVDRFLPILYPPD